MKKFLLSLCALCTAVVMNAQQEVVFDFDNNATALFGIEGRSTSDIHDGDILADATATVDGVSITVSPKASGSNENRLWSTSPVLRMYSGTMTISAPGKNITGISFNSKKFDATNTFDCGTYANYVWTADGNTSTVVLTVKKNTQLSGMTVTVVSEGQVVVAKPTASVAGGTYYEPQTIELTAEEGATIKYTLNGGAEQTYAAPFTISETTTLVAWAEKDGAKSGELTVEYVFASTSAGTLADAIAANDGDAVTIGEAMTVVYQYGAYLYVKAGDTYALIYKNGGVGISYNPGDVIASGVTVKKTTYNGLIELTEPEGLTEGVAGNPVAPIATNTLECASDAWVNKYIVISNASYNAATKTLTDAEGELAMYKRFDVALPENDMENVTVEGLLSVYKGTYQLQPTSIKGDEQTPGTPDTPEDPTEPKDVLVVEGNLLDNGSFEAWTGNEPDNWKSTTTASNATLSAVTTKDAHTGKVAVQLASASSNKRLAYKEITLPAGVYEFTFYARAAAEGAEAKLVPGYVPIDEEGKVGTYKYDYDAEASILTTEYQKVTSLFELTEATTINLVIMLRKNTAEVIIDDAALVLTDIPVGINSAKAESQDNAAYTIGGVRTNMSKAGLYIVNGKKVMMK